MKPVGGQALDFTARSFFPEELFEEIMPEDLGILTLICYPLKPGFTYEPDTTPWDGIYYETGVPLLDCE